MARISPCCSTIKGKDSPGGAPSTLLLALAVRILVVDLDGPGLELGEGADSRSCRNVGDHGREDAVTTVGVVGRIWCKAPASVSTEIFSIGV